MNATPWVRWFPSDFLNGIADLDPYEIAVYAVVLNLIYDKGGPVANDPGKIARRCNMRKKTAEAAIKRLVAAGKLTLHDDVIDNKRCVEELKHRRNLVQKLTELSKLGVQKRAENANENNKSKEAAVTGGSAHGEPIQIQIQKEKKEDTLPVSSKEPTEPKPKRLKEMLRALPKDFQLDDKLLVAAIDCGLPAAHAPHEFLKFRDTHAAKGSHFVDWPAAWRTWCRKAVERPTLFGNIPLVPPPPPPAPEDVQRHWINKLTLWRRGEWQTGWGPAPLEKDCSIPDDFVRTWQKEKAA